MSTSDDSADEGGTSDTDWGRVMTMTDEEIEANALADPDNPPMTDERYATLKRVPQVKVMRYALRLSQEEFAGRYAIPLETLVSWEEARTEPDTLAKAYLRVIAHEPEAVARALAARPAAA